MMKTATVALLALCALAAPAFAANYPVSGKWGASDRDDKGPIDCSDLRIIDFQGNQRTDSKGGVRAFRNLSVTADGSASFRIVDQFTTGQINGRTTFTLRQIDSDRIELHLQPGGTIRLNRCQ
jgi:hypothetical protein